MDAVGGARQDSRPWGQVENGQEGVFPGYASRYGYALVDNRRFLPEGRLPEA